MLSTALPAAPPRPALPWLWRLAGLLCLGLAVLGALLPLMPTTVFLIGAAACFGRASPQWEARLLAHPRFGPTLRHWREQGAIAAPAKAWACGGMALGLGLSCWLIRPGWLLGGALAALMGLCAAFVLSRPAPRPGTGPKAGGAGKTRLPLNRRRLLRWGLACSALAHGLLLAGLLGLRSPTIPAPPSEAARPVLMQAQWLPAAAPPRPLEAREAPPSAARAARRDVARPQSRPQPATLPVPSTPPLIAMPAESQAASPALSSPPPAPAPAPAPAPNRDAAPAAAPPAPALPPAPQAGGLHSESWQARVLARLERFRSYPAGARARREQGTVLLRLRLGRQGQVLMARLERPSGHGELDQAALQTVQRAQPLPAIPPELPEELELLVPVEFFFQGA